MLAFIPRKWRLARWQVLLGIALTVAWWGLIALKYGQDSPSDYMDSVDWAHLNGLRSEGMNAEAKAFEAECYAKHLSEAWAPASLAAPAWLLYWAIIVAVRRVPAVARVLVEIAAFAAMLGVAMFVTHLFPSKHFWHGQASDDPVYSPMVFASVLICEVALYIAWKIINAGRAVQTVSHSPIRSERSRAKQRGNGASGRRRAVTRSPESPSQRMSRFISARRRSG